MIEPGTHRPDPPAAPEMPVAALKILNDFAREFDVLLRDHGPPPTNKILSERSARAWSALIEAARSIEAPVTRVSTVLDELADLAAICRGGRQQRRDYSWATLDALLGRFPVPNVALEISVGGAYETVLYGRMDSDRPTFMGGRAGADVRRLIVLGVAAARVVRLPDTSLQAARWLGLDSAVAAFMPDLRARARTAPDDVRSALAEHCERVGALVEVAYSVLEREEDGLKAQPLGPRTLERESRAPAAWSLASALLDAFSPDAVPRRERLTACNEKIARMLFKLKTLDVDGSRPFARLRYKVTEGMYREIVQLLAQKRAITRISAALLAAPSPPDPRAIPFLLAWCEEVDMRIQAGGRFGRRDGDPRHFGIALPDLKLIANADFSNEPVSFLATLRTSSYLQTKAAALQAG